MEKRWEKARGNLHDADWAFHTMKACGSRKKMHTSTRKCDETRAIVYLQVRQ